MSSPGLERTELEIVTEEREDSSFKRMKGITVSDEMRPRVDDMVKKKFRIKHEGCFSEFRVKFVDK